MIVNVDEKTIVDTLESFISERMVQYFKTHVRTPEDFQEWLKVMYRLAPVFPECGEIAALLEDKPKIHGLVGCAIRRPEN